ncbi:MAG: NAD(P)-dependent alcohol dehydrogenase [Actinobacteria bacterium]|nr:NAD(P)-dependent alcohol dehydrogenase [Actinomycetota bacterium]
MPTVTAYATPAAKAPFERTTIERREVGPKDVRIDIKFAGICHSDIHTGRDEWGAATYPLVPGHEIAGIVAEVGSEVTTHAVGDRVGVGCLVNSCRDCDHCQQGLEQYCLGKSVGTYNDVDVDGTPTYGGYSKEVVVDEHFVLHIPDALELDIAAPLLCAGITMFSPLNHWKCGPGKKVAIVGLGGLGHVGVKIAAAMGADVSVLSQSLSKQDDGLAFGATSYYATSDPATLKSLRGTFDLIINTVSAPLPMSKFLSLLRLDGTLVNVGAPPEPQEISVGVLMGARRSWAGSGIGGIPETQQMLDFCAEHGIGAEIETISGEQIDEAWDRVVGSDVRYRFVIDTSTF